VAVELVVYGPDIAILVSARRPTLEEIVEDVRVQDGVAVVLEDAAEDFDGLRADGGDVLDEVLDVVADLVERDADEVAGVGEVVEVVAHLVVGQQLGRVEVV